MTRTEKRIYLALLLAFGGLMLGGYGSGDFAKLSRLRTPGDASRQRALDRLLGSDQPFNAAADSVTQSASGRGDTLSWKTLSHAAFRHGKQIEVDYGADVAKLDGAPVTLTGYIFPLEASGDQRHFLLSAYPPSCPYCLPGGATELVEITANPALKFTYDAVSVHGRLKLLHGEELKSGMFYQLTEVTGDKTKR